MHSSQYLQHIKSINRKISLNIAQKNKPICTGRVIFEPTQIEYVILPLLVFILKKEEISTSKCTKTHT